MGSRIAIWWPDDPPAVEQWWPAKVMKKCKDGQTSYIVRYDSDASEWEVDLSRGWKWRPNPPKFSPRCTECGCADVSGGTTAKGSAGASTYAYEPDRCKVARKKYTCEQCGAVVTCKNPDMLARTDPAGPRITEDADVRLYAPRARLPPPPRPAAGVRQSPRLAAAPAGGATNAGNSSAADAQQAAAGAAKPKPRPGFRPDADPNPYVRDAVLAYQNTNGLAAPGAARAYLRDVALALADVTAISETGWAETRLKHLSDDMAAKGHRLWGATPTTRGHKGSGTAVVVRSSIEAAPGDGPVWRKADGKAMLVALTIGGRAVYMLAAHLPHTDADREAFLLEVTAALPPALATHATSLDDTGKPVGGAWAGAAMLWAADLNMTPASALDDEADRKPPTQGVLAALQGLNGLFGDAADVYRTVSPRGRTYTHGRPEKKNQRRIDAWYAAASLLVGAQGVVATRTVSREQAGFSYRSLHTRKEHHKTSDHCMVQVTLRTCDMARPPPRPRVHAATPRHPEVRKAVDALIEEASAPDSDVGHAVECLHEEVLEIYLRHQRAAAKRRGKTRKNTLTRIRRLQEKVASLPESAARNASVATLARYRAKLQGQDHGARRRRDAQDTYEEQMAAAGLGKAAKPRTQPTPITRIETRGAMRVACTLASEGGRVRLSMACEQATPARIATTQADIMAAKQSFWGRYQSDVHTPSEQARRDADGVFARLKRETASALPPLLRLSLTAQNLTGSENVKEAITSLARDSTPGSDFIPLEFYLVHIDKMAPLLSKLYREVLDKGRMTDTMVKSVLSPIFKDKGSTADCAMYRPISVTTMAYRIFGRCIAQQLNKAVRFLIGDPQAGFSPGRTQDENVSTLRGTIHAVNNQRPEDGGVVLMLDNTKAFDRLQHDFMFRTLEAFNLPPCLVGAVRTMYTDAETVMKMNGEVSKDAFKCLSGVKQGCPLSPLLYNLVQEVQLRMIRQDRSIAGIPIPDADGRTAPAALRTRSPELKERGLVDDTMVALASADSIPALIRALDRFEAMSHSRMNLAKTVCLVLGGERSFDISGASPAAQMLRRRGLTRTYDISEGKDDTLPDKWHGVVLGNEAGAQRVWRDACDEARRAAEAQQACAMPYGSRGRQVLAQGKIMGKVNAALRLTVPHSDRAVDKGLAAIQSHADRTVFGRRHWLTLAAAKQPRDSMGVGHLDVKAAVQAGWLKPLLAAAGQTQDQRPFKSYYAAYAREAYPALGMGRELLTLSLGFHRIAALPPEAIPGEAKHAFAAYATLPPLTYLEPDDDSPCVPRERMRYEDLLRQPLLLNPMLESEPRRRRATAKEEDEYLWWAEHGLRRVRDALTADGKRVLTYPELVSRHADLAGGQVPTRRLRP